MEIRVAAGGTGAPRIAAAVFAIGEAFTPGRLPTPPSPESFTGSDRLIVLNLNARVSHDVPRFPRRRHELIPAVVGEGGTAIHSWENEGGSYSMTEEPDLEADGCEKPPARLEWYAFLSRYFPGRRRHDLEALKAYETYRSAVAGNSFTAAGRVPIASIP